MWGTILNGCFNNLANAQSSSCPNGDANRNDNSNLTLSVDLANLPTICSGATHFELSYWEHSEGVFSADMLFVVVDGAVAPSLSTCDSKSRGGWRKRTLDLSSYIGKTFDIVWSFISTSGVNRAGAYIDDVEITCS